MRTVFNPPKMTRCTSLVIQAGLPARVVVAAPLVLGMTTVIAEALLSSLMPAVLVDYRTLQRHPLQSGFGILKAVMTDRQALGKWPTLTCLAAGHLCRTGIASCSAICNNNICKHYVVRATSTAASCCCPGAAANPSQLMQGMASPVQAEVRVAETTADDGTVTAWRAAESGEKVTGHHAALPLAWAMRGDADNLFEDSWRRISDRFSEVTSTAGTVTAYSEPARQRDDAYCRSL